MKIAPSFAAAVITLVAMLLGSGCSLVPKQVEYFQDKVKPLPEIGKTADESLRQAASMAADKARETEKAAVTTGAAEEVRRPAGEAVALTDAVADRLGPPAQPWKGEVAALVTRMDAQEARLRRALEDYREEAQENAGKKIEGTGAITVGYFTHILIIAVVGAVAWVIVKVVATVNAPVAVGLRTVEGGGKFLARALSEVIEGGQEFKNLVRKRFADNPALAEQVLGDFQAAHLAKQSRDTQGAVISVKG